MNEMIVDFHTHTFPDRIAARAIDKLKHAGGIVPFSDGTEAALRASMHRAGIDRSVVLPVATNPLKASSLNDVSIQKLGDDELIYFGGIHPDTPGMEAELARIARAGIRGIKIHPVYQDVDIDDPRFLRVLEKAGELGLVVLMHTGADIAFPGVVRCSPAMTANALRQVGPVKLICAHMGGWGNWETAAEYLFDTSAMLDTAYCLGRITPLEPGAHPEEELGMLDGEVFCRLVRTFGAERVLFGSDSPWSDQAQYLAQVTALPLTDQEKQAILGGNASALLGL